MQAGSKSQSRKKTSNRVTLWDVFLRNCTATQRARPNPLAVAILSDANIELITGILRQKAITQLGPLAPSSDALTVDSCDAFATALIVTATNMGGLDVRANTLESANRAILETTLSRLSTEQSTWQKWREYNKMGERLDERPEFDSDRADRKELQRPGVGKGVYNPWESYAEERGLIDTFQPFNGLSMREMSDSDDMRVQIVPWAPAAVHGQIPW